LSARTNAAQAGLAIELDAPPGSPSQWRPQPSYLCLRCTHGVGKTVRRGPARQRSRSRGADQNVSTNRGPAHPRRGWAGWLSFFASR